MSTKYSLGAIELIELGDGGPRRGCREPYLAQARRRREGNLAGPKLSQGIGGTGATVIPIAIFGAVMAVIFY